jgi:hypothetical protein
MKSTNLHNLKKKKFINRSNFEQLNKRLVKCKKFYRLIPLPGGGS